MGHRCTQIRRNFFFICVDLCSSLFIRMARGEWSGDAQLVPEPVKAINSSGGIQNVNATFDLTRIAMKWTAGAEKGYKYI
jgi:hypothetical protein